MKQSLKNRLTDYRNSLSFVGIVFAALFFATSVTPSLLPRVYLVQGVLSGLALAIGYGVGVALLGCYRFLDLPEPGGHARYAAERVVFVLVAILFIGFIWRMTFWQNSIRELMQMERLTTAYPFRVSLIAVAIGVLLVSVARLFRSCGNYLASKLERFVPRKIALAAGYLFLVVPKRSIDSATALFNAIYAHWKTLPSSSRPRLYLHGLSLGSLGSERSADLLTIFEDPIQGAVWSGPPFPSQIWRRIVENRKKSSPAWLTTFRDGRIVRFTAQKNALDTGQSWGAMRFVYIQYASDPMIWFSPDLAWIHPDWLSGDRGPDVSKALRWYSIVTFLQVACDLPMATAVPIGYGHNYSPSSYIDAWIAVTEPEDWTPQKTVRLKSRFRAKDTPKP